MCRRIIWTATLNWVKEQGLGGIGLWVLDGSPQPVAQPRPTRRNRQSFHKDIRKSSQRYLKFRPRITRIYADKKEICEPSYRSLHKFPHFGGASSGSPTSFLFQTIRSAGAPVSNRLGAVAWGMTDRRRRQPAERRFGNRRAKKLMSAQELTAVVKAWPNHVFSVFRA